MFLKINKNNKNNNILYNQKNLMILIYITNYKRII